MNGQKKKNPNQTMILRIIIEKKNEGTARKSEGRYKRAVKIQSRPNTVMRIKENSRTDGDEVRKGRMKEREREREREAGTVDSISDDGLLFQRQRQHPAGDRFRATAVPSISRIIKLSLPRHKQPPRPPITCSLSLSLSLSLPPSLLIIDGTHTDARAHSI